MSDILKVLRTPGPKYRLVDSDVLIKAADEIERLRSLSTQAVDVGETEGWRPIETAERGGAPAPVDHAKVTHAMVDAAKSAYWHEVHNGGGYSDKCYEAALRAALASEVTAK